VVVIAALPAPIYTNIVVGEPMNTKHVVKLLGAIPTVLVALLMILCTVPLDMVAASDEAATDRSGFDEYSTSGCTDDGTIYHSASYGIRLISGWAKFEMSDFRELDLDFYVYFNGLNDKLVVTIEDEDDSSNEITITFTCKTATETSVDVDDDYGASSSEDETKAVDTYQTWQAVSIDISDTSESTDGTKTEISVSVGGTDFIDDMKLASAELSAKAKTRKLNDITFTSPTANDDATIDDVTADGDSGQNYTYTLWGSIIGVSLVALTWHFNVPPFNKKGFIRRKIGR